MSHTRGTVALVPAMASTTKKTKGAKAEGKSESGKAGFSLDAIKVPSLHIPGAKYGLLLTAAALALIYVDGIAFPFCILSFLTVRLLQHLPRDCFLCCVLRASFTNSIRK